MIKNDNWKNRDKTKIQNKFYCWLKVELKKKLIEQKDKKIKIMKIKIEMKNKKNILKSEIEKNNQCNKRQKTNQ